MRTMDLIRWQLELTRHATLGAAEVMKSAPMTPSTPGAKGGHGNHPVWTLGHLCWIEGVMVKILTGRDNPVPEYEKRFAAGTTPTLDPGIYPSFDTLIEQYQALRAGTLRTLEEIGEAGLDAPPKWVPPQFSDVMTSNGRTLGLLALHNMSHLGQMSDARRVAGFPARM